jgi:hypothetical protein
MIVCALRERRTSKFMCLLPDDVQMMAPIRAVFRRAVVHSAPGNTKKLRRVWVDQPLLLELPEHGERNLLRADRERLHLHRRCLDARLMRRDRPSVHLRRLHSYRVPPSRLTGAVSFSVALAPCVERRFHPLGPLTTVSA